MKRTDVWQHTCQAWIFHSVILKIFETFFGETLRKIRLRLKAFRN